MMYEPVATTYKKWTILSIHTDFYSGKSKIKTQGTQSDLLRSWLALTHFVSEYLEISPKTLAKKLTDASQGGPA